jgi:hypothetical protein
MPATRFVLVPPSWPLADTHLARTLGRGKGETPWVAVARVEQGELRFVPRRGLGAADIRRLVGEAQAHLDGQRTSWGVAEMSSGFLGLFKKPTLVSATGGVDMELLEIPKGEEPRYGLTMKIAGALVADDYAPERVLSPTALAEAHRILNAPSLIAVMPKRGMLLVGRGQPGELPAMVRMNKAAKEIHDRAGAAAVCDHGYFVNDGRIVGVSAQGYLSLFPADADPWGPDW